ncbi:aminoacyl-tRNA deacylase [Christensenellaceae bacterium OttesenSCG-928-L17]|nr:aminoacyl-tRNA deacylase [Christensenellaceae bacterium OttesenSCG-928-L17]
MAKPQKTNAMRMLERAGVAYKPVAYELGDVEFSGEAVAEITGIPAEQSFKTLCALSAKRSIIVFVVPVSEELNLKAAALAAGEKRVEMAQAKDLLALTGYVRGCVSPVGMKKAYPVFVDESALRFSEIAVSAGAKGQSMLVEPRALAACLRAEFVKLT